MEKEHGIFLDKRVWNAGEALTFNYDITIGDPDKVYYTAFHKKGGENMGLYKVIFVYPKNNVWETVKVIAKSEENAKIKALKVSNFAEINIDKLIIEVEEMVTWDKEDYK